MRKHLGRGGRRKAFLVLLAVPALALTACGGSTVESADVTTTSSSTSETTSSSEETTSSEQSPTAERQSNDSAASRASSLPDNRVPLTEEDEDFLDAMDSSSIDIEGTEDQVMAAARSECVDGEDPEYSEILIEAVSGQLIAQERTELSESEVAQIIADAAESAYC